MNRKQGIIIVTLLALIVCAGVLATRLSSPLYVNGTDGSGSSTASVTDTKQTGTANYFEESKLTRDQKNVQTLQTLKSLADDTKVSQENRDEAAAKYTELAMNNNYESRIESTLKGKGYSDALCAIDGDKVRVTIKGKEKLTDKETRVIKDVVISISKLSNVEIEVKQ